MISPPPALIYVYARNVLDAVKAAVDRNLAPVISMSFGVCEARMPGAEVEALRNAGAALVRMRAGRDGDLFLPARRRPRSW